MTESGSDDGVSTLCLLVEAEARVEVAHETDAVQCRDASDALRHHHLVPHRFYACSVLYQHNLSNLNSYPTGEAFRPSHRKYRCHCLIMLQAQLSTTIVENVVGKTSIFRDFYTTWVLKDNKGKPVGLVCRRMTVWQSNIPS